MESCLDDRRKEYKGVKNNRYNAPFRHCQDAPPTHHFFASYVVLLELGYPSSQNQYDIRDNT